MSSEFAGIRENVPKLSVYNANATTAPMVGGAPGWINIVIEANNIIIVIATAKAILSYCEYHLHHFTSY